MHFPLRDEKKIVPLYSHTTSNFNLYLSFSSEESRLREIAFLFFFCCYCMSNSQSSCMPSEAPFMICFTLLPALTGLGSMR